MAPEQPPAARKRPRQSRLPERSQRRRGHAPADRHRGADRHAPPQGLPPGAPPRRAEAPRLRRHPALRPDQHPLRHRRAQHDGLDAPQRRALLLRGDRRPGGAVRIPHLRPTCSTPAWRPSTRSAPRSSWFYFGAGQRGPERAKLWAAEIADLVRQHGGGNRRLAVDKCDFHGVDALRAEGIETMDGQEVTELARRIKSPEELACMQASIAVAEAGMARMQRGAQARPHARTSFGRSCTSSTSPMAASGSRPASWPRGRAPTPGSRNAATA